VNCVTDEKHVQRGRELIDALQGDGTGERMYAALAEDSAEFAAFSIAGSYGAVYDRSGLDLQQRQLVTIGVLAALGGCEAQLERHVLVALRAGLEPEQVFEACVQVAVYAGHARANNAFRAAAAAIRRQRAADQRSSPLAASRRSRMCRSRPCPMTVASTPAIWKQPR
jgi:4-carboxymuconolactone decarboxylase